jgi:S1-C subfamily serine protease
MGNVQAFNTDKIGFQVTAVSPKSPGEQAGLKVTDDFILTMNGLALPFIEPEKIMSTVKVQ